MIKRQAGKRSQGRGKAQDHYRAVHSGFHWQVDEYFNIAEVCCSRWARARGKKIAIRTHLPGSKTGKGRFYSYAQLKTAADALSHTLQGLGVQRGDRVGIVMPQRFETAAAYMAVFQMGAVAMPLSMLFGPEALQFRLHDSGAVLAICDESSIASIKSVRSECPLLRRVIAVGAAMGQGDLDYDAAAVIAAEGAAFTAVKTKAEEAAVLIYTSGTTGPPKGAVIPHRALIGNLPGFVCSQNWFGFDPYPASQTPSLARGMAGEGASTNRARPIEGDQNASVFWSPADWAWTGGLMDALLPTLYFGRPIVAFNGRFSPELAFSLMQQHGVTHTFLFPTALKAMMKAYPQPARHFGLKLQGIMSAGEAVGDAVFDYCRKQLGVTVNEMFGQTEINYVVGNCAALWPARPGSMGKGYPGHRVAVIDNEGRECDVGVPGDVAVNRFDVHGAPDPIFFLGYWKNIAATEGKYTGDWCRTGDLAKRDADGYLWYEGRADDVFKAAGYRIGPGEIENCLVKHEAVANAAVVPKPDRERGAVVKAYVVLAPGTLAARERWTGTPELFDRDVIERLQVHIKTMLAPYEYPKEIEFIDALPMTTTGKVQRRVLRLQEEERFKRASEGV
ncbi:MAG: AMP-binding protein [Pseudomonadota bacterium]